MSDSDSPSSSLLKLATGAGAVVLFTASLIQLSSGTHYFTQTLVCGYNLLFALVIVLTEFSPLVREEYLFMVFPFLSSNYGKSFFYLIIGTFCFDSQLSNFAMCGGVALISAAILWIALQARDDFRQEKEIKRDFQHPPASFETMGPGMHLEEGDIYSSSYSFAGTTRSNNSKYVPPTV